MATETRRHGENKIQIEEIDTETRRHGENKIQIEEIDTETRRRGENKIQIEEIDTETRRRGEKKTHIDPAHSPLDALAGEIIAAAIEVHRVLGPGLLEPMYEAAICVELRLRGIEYECQKRVPVEYKGNLIANHRLDLLVADAIVVEIKSVERFDPVHEAQVLTYLRITGKRLGLLLNFNSRLLKEGIKRYVV